LIKKKILIIAKTILQLYLQAIKKIKRVHQPGWETRNKDGNFDINCPPNYKVLGCHLQTTELTTETEKWRSFYPIMSTSGIGFANDNGKGCTCHDRYGGM
jgi:hypothetical protein